MTIIITDLEIITPEDDYCDGWCIECVLVGVVQMNKKIKYSQT